MTTDAVSDLSYADTLWKAADALRGQVDAAEYKHVVLGLLFLKYISDSFETRRNQLKAELEKDGIKGKQLESLLESRDEYTAERVFWVPPESRWPNLQNQATHPDIATLIDDAILAVERDNPNLKSKLPRDYARRGIEPIKLKGLIDLIAGIGFKGARDKARDTLGRVYEYFLGKFAAAEGKLGGEFYTPRSVVRVLVEMLEPYAGRVYDPCCGSGGMFVQSEKFVEAHGGNRTDVSVFGQESNPTTWRLAHMNLAIHGIEANLGPAPADTFLRDQHPDLKADFVLANPPFNVSDWSGQLLRGDKRFAFGDPPVGNANYAWIQHFIHHLAYPNGRGGGVAGFVMANGSLSSNTGGEGEIRRKIVEADLVDCIVALPAQLFFTTGIPVCLWFITRDKRGYPSPPAPLPGGEGSQYRGGYYFSGLVQRARELRQKATPAEQVAWELLRDRRFLDLKFRRQHQIGDYVVDFYCDEKKLVLELDGGVHDTPDRQKTDHKRDAYLRALDLVVLRFPNEQMLDHPEDVLAEIGSRMNPSPPGRGAGVRVVPDTQSSQKPKRARHGETLFIDARKLGTLQTRTLRVLSGLEDAECVPGTSDPLPTSDIGRIVYAYRQWRGEPAPDWWNKKEHGEWAFTATPGFAKPATIEEIAKHGHVLTPGRYVGAEDIEEDAEPFAEKYPRLVAEVEACLKEGERLAHVIREQLGRIES